MLKTREKSNRFYGFTSLVFVDLIERLRVAVERRSPKPDMVPRTRLQDVESELAIRNQVSFVLNYVPLVINVKLKLCNNVIMCM